MTLAPPSGSGGRPLQGGVKALPPSPRSRSRGRTRHNDTAGITEGTVIDSAYIVTRRIGGGAFSTCWGGHVRGRERDEVCFKVEDAATLKSRAKLREEFDVLSALASYGDAGEQSKFVPTPVHYSQLSPTVSVMVMELMGPSLGDCLSRCGGRFTPATTAFVAMQMLECLEAVHAAGFIHRDVKPQNFLVGLGPRAHRVYIADFGLARPLPSRPQPTLHNRPAGTIRYVSLNAHRGVEQHTRDDLESVAYVLVQFLMGKLPWQDAPGSPTRQRRHEMIHEHKEKCTVQALCQGCPHEVARYLHICRDMGFGDPVPYDDLLDLFQAVMDRELAAAGMSPQRPRGRGRFVPDWERPGARASSSRAGSSQSPARPPATPPSMKRPGQAQGGGYSATQSASVIRRPMGAAPSQTPAQQPSQHPHPGSLSKDSRSPPVQASTPAFKRSNSPRRGASTRYASSSASTSVQSSMSPRASPLNPPPQVCTPKTQHRTAQPPVREASPPTFGVGDAVDALFGRAYHPGRIYRHDKDSNTYVIHWSDGTYTANVVPSHIRLRRVDSAAPAGGAAGGSGHASSRRMPSPRPSPAASSRSSPPHPPIPPGTWVDARYRGDLYKAYVHAYDPQDGTYTICWDDGSHSVGVLRTDIYPLGS